MQLNVLQAIALTSIEITAIAPISLVKVGKVYVSRGSHSIHSSPTPLPLSTLNIIAIMISAIFGEFIILTAILLLILYSS